jgi:hypothetical protein
MTTNDQATPSSLQSGNLSDEFEKHCRDRDKQKTEHLKKLVVGKDTVLESEIIITYKKPEQSEDE